jgi:DNA-binding SARP family transcriptional activator
MWETAADCCRVATGRHSDLVGELERLIAEHPYQERLRAQLLHAHLERSEDAELHRRAATITPSCSRT